MQELEIIFVISLIYFLVAQREVSLDCSLNSHIVIVMLRMRRIPNRLPMQRQHKSGMETSAKQIFRFELLTTQRCIHHNRNNIQKHVLKLK